MSDYIPVIGRDHVVTATGAMTRDEFYSRLWRSPEGEAMADRLLADEEAAATAGRRVHADRIAAANRQKAEADKLAAPKIAVAGAEVVRLRAELRKAEALIARLVLDRAEIDQHADSKIRDAERALTTTAPMIINGFVRQWREYDIEHLSYKCSVEDRTSPAEAAKAARWKRMGEKVRFEPVMVSDKPAWLARRRAIFQAIAEAEALYLEPDIAVIRNTLTRLAAGIPYVDAALPFIRVDRDNNPLEPLPHQLDEAAE